MTPPRRPPPERAALGQSAAPRAADQAEQPAARGHFQASTYFSVWQLRADAWAILEGLTRQLVEPGTPAEDIEEVPKRLLEIFDLLEPVERYWAFPGLQVFAALRRLLEGGERERLNRAVTQVQRALVNDERGRAAEARRQDPALADPLSAGTRRWLERNGKPHFEVLLVDGESPDGQSRIREDLLRLRQSDDEFSYDVVVVPSVEEALIAVLLNADLQACVVGSGFTAHSRHELGVVRQFLAGVVEPSQGTVSTRTASLQLGSRVHALRPELDLYLLTPVLVEETAGELDHVFRRVFHSNDDLLELHQSLLRGVAERYRTPFFTALKEYSRRPVGVFHALPISRGKSVVRSRWIQDMADFYGLRLLLAETSATSGGLDSLLEPQGTIRQAQDLAARAFGSHQTFFVTNGTSTANKIVVQALLRPGDVALVDRSCHISQHYGLALAGAQVTYLDPYPISDFWMSGAVPIQEIKRVLLRYRSAGQLERVKLLMLTNCTFDGLVYDTERVMDECLAIKPDLVFLWDEAWFAFAGFHPTYQRRTAMASARRLLQRYRDPAYRKRYAANRDAESLEGKSDEALLARRLVADPERARVRVYATQSIHKTLTALRQGSMIHVFDQDYGAKVEDAFHEAYMTHTSTSPNYQILASLDVGRRQVELEGFKLVQRQVELAMMLWEHAEKHSGIREFFHFLTTQDLIPPEHRLSGIEVPLAGGWVKMDEAWRQDELVLDPSRLHLHIGPTGIDGETFKARYLMDRYGVQVNKTSRNTVLFMTNIGTSRSSVAYLIEVLANLARDLGEHFEAMGPAQRRLHEAQVARLSRGVAPPPFSGFADAFRGGAAVPDGDLRGALFLGQGDSAREMVGLEELRSRLGEGQLVVSAGFVTPYPPGYPLLVPGQVVDEATVAFLDVLDTTEIHGYHREEGLRVLRDQAGVAQPPGRAAARGGPQAPGRADRRGPSASAGTGQPGAAGTGLKQPGAVGESAHPGGGAGGGKSQSMEDHPR